jgi:DNA repair protein RecO (recombination protein O)
MEWSDEGIVLASRKHGEASAVVQLFTHAHGRHAGLVRGGGASKARGVYQSGNLVAARWRARLAEHLGAYTCEPLKSHAAALLDDPLGLAALTSACALLAVALPERHPYPVLYDATLSLIEALAGGEPAWPALYVRWELDLLRELGFGLDLTRCAATGTTDDLAYVSPKSGRAVSRTAGEPWRTRLLPLPGFLIGAAEAGAGEAGAGEAGAADVAAGLRLSGSFLERHLFAPHERKLPAARERFVERFTRTTTRSGGIVADAE